MQNQFIFFVCHAGKQTVRRSFIKIAQFHYIFSCNLCGTGM